MGRAQEDEMLWDADKEGRVTLRHSLAGGPPQGHRGYKATGRAGEGTKKKRDGYKRKHGDLFYSPSLSNFDYISFKNLINQYFGYQI